VEVVAGLVGLDKPLGPEWVFQPEIFSILAELKLGAPIGVDALARVLGHPQGGLQNIPPGARKTVLLTGAYTLKLQAAGGRIAAHLTGTYESILVAEVHDPPPSGEVLAVYEGEAAIVLAAGGSERMGSPKQLLDWHGELFVHKVARSALQAGCSPVIVVTGANAEAVSAAVADLPVQVVHNPDWSVGQSGSLKIGLAALPPGTGCALFLLVDQPQISPTLITALLERHRVSLAPVTAPQVDGQRANPILFDRSTFPALLTLRGDTGGRSVLSQFKIDWLQWYDLRQLLDVDTPEDYARLLEAS
jgi:molybdenum cofactor cytidylyltransferase